MNKRILIVEDDISNSRMFYLLLKSYDYEIIDSADGMDGIKKAKENKPDIILLDVYSPGMDPYLITRSIKNDPELNKTPVIVLTSFAVEGDKKNALDAGADGIIEKPVNPEMFISQMESIARSHRNIIRQ